MGTVLVVGGINQDLTVVVDRRPGPGETVVGEGPHASPGGKGGNQAAAAAYAGARVRLCAVVGEDAAGTEQLALLERAGVEVSGVRRAAGAPTGTALILLTPDGENSIVVGAGANALLDRHDVLAALRDDRPSVVLLQTEPGAAPAEAAAAEAVRLGVRVVLNAAPPEGLPADLLAAADPLVVNEHEAAVLLGAPAEDAAAALRTRLGCASVVVSLGAAGALVATPSGTTRVSSPPVRAVDTTGAGDVLVGVVAARLADGVDLVAAVRDACDLAARAVTVVGARGYAMIDPAPDTAPSREAHR